MPLLGAHQSIAGGYYKAVEAAAGLNMDCVQIFTKNNNQWRAKPLTDDDVRLFREAQESTGIRHACAHVSYLINLASSNEQLWKKSLDSFVVELERAEALGLLGLVMHPGSYVDGSEKRGLARVAKALNIATKRTKGFSVEIWVETTAGQGTSLGWRFEHLREILARVSAGERMGVCVDSCHIFVAGYELRTKSEYNATIEQLDETVGIPRVRAFHLNDSKRELGSRVDRHDHIGEGCLGRQAFRHILTDPRFSRLPMYLETPKGIRDGKNLDAINMKTLRQLAKKPRRKAIARSKPR
jgi:deoxyribonuclease-4